MYDWLGVLILGIVVTAIGYIVNRVFANPQLKTLGWVVMIIGIVIIIIAIILLVLSLAGIALLT